MRLVEVLSSNNLEILNEVAVQSSWIDDVTLDDNGEDVIMTLLSGRQYMLYGVPEELFDEWTIAPSPGKFWWEYMAGQYNTTRIA